MENLEIPKEPKDVKQWIRSLEPHLQGSKDIDWESLNVWYGNKLPKYLWDAWKDELAPPGFNWQKFLKLMKYRTDKIILWSNNKISWEDLAEELIELINGPLGQQIAKAGESEKR